jgi:hypothetical protein
MNHFILIHRNRFFSMHPLVVIFPEGRLSFIRPVKNKARQEFLGSLFIFDPRSFTVSKSLQFLSCFSLSPGRRKNRIGPSSSGHSPKELGAR